MTAARIASIRAVNVTVACRRCGTVLFIPNEYDQRTIDLFASAHLEPFIASWATVTVIESPSPPERPCQPDSPTAR